MHVIEGRTWLEILSPRSCWDLLGAGAVGRIGVVVDGAPEIYPVNFAVDGRSIVFRTDPGSKLRSVEHLAAVCFEVDVVDPDRRLGWSVLVKGRAHEVARHEQVHELERLDLRPWALGRKAHWIRIDPDAVTGRRIHTSADPVDP